MIIGDWEVTLVKDIEIPNKPGDPEAGHQRQIVARFKYIPGKFVMDREITYIEFYNEDRFLANLTEHTVQLKQFVDSQGE